MTDSRNLFGPEQPAPPIGPALPDVNLGNPSGNPADHIARETMQKMVALEPVAPEDAAFIAELSLWADAERQSTGPQLEALQQQNDQLRSQLGMLPPEVGELKKLRQQLSDTKDELYAAHAAIIAAHEDSDRAKQKAEQERENAQTDELTGVYNRKAIDRIIISGALDVIEDQTGSKQFMMNFIDINYLKKINDAFGHIKGDELIKEVAEAALDWVARFAPHLAVVRIGGDELTVAGAVDPSTLGGEGEDLQSWVNRRLAIGFADGLPKGHKARQLGPKIGVSVGTIWTDKTTVRETIDVVAAASREIQKALSYPQDKWSDELAQAAAEYLERKSKSSRPKNRPQRTEQHMTEDDIVKLANQLALADAVEKVHREADDKMYQNKVAQKRRLRWRRS